MSFVTVLKAVANNFLVGNISCEPANSIHGKSTTNDSTVYLPQLNIFKINSVMMKEAVHKNGFSMDISEVKLVAMTTSNQRIGKIK